MINFSGFKTPKTSRGTPQQKVTPQTLKVRQDLFPEKNKTNQPNPASDRTTSNSTNIDINIAQNRDYAVKKVTLDSPIPPKKPLKSTLECIMTLFDLPLPKDVPNKQGKPPETRKPEKEDEGPTPKMKKTTQQNKPKQKPPINRKTCTKCAKTFKSKKQLNHHQVTECLKTLQTNTDNSLDGDVIFVSALKTRLKNLLPSETKYKCEKCGKAYKFSNVLQQHRMMGCEIGSHRLCPFCPIQDTHQLCLEDHLKAEHPNEIQNQ